MDGCGDVAPELFLRGACLVVLFGVYLKKCWATTLAILGLSLFLLLCD